MEWKSKDGEYESSSLADYDTFFRGIFKKEHLLDIIRNFICYSNEENKVKVMAGYHQYFAVNKALERAKKAVESNGKIGVFWHTQGSGRAGCAAPDPWRPVPVLPVRSPTARPRQR